eukprot:CAMPEP_0183569836 /NCGR_PEP_ID=MMETSP0371-20130417/121446_1 /TAXON_ID=268820 /ORGANISM="Peridinium aciculiferum, Strain PAER-2" /LENGTH=58 /DNA_ID=CAMNT_0025779459 /DNA_START=20 /DNA_END=192 /DNA_ORIENTATION=-
MPILRRCHLAVSMSSAHSPRSHRGKNTPCTPDCSWAARTQADVPTTSTTAHSNASHGS